jgi:hypothetical protein
MGKAEEAINLTNGLLDNIRLSLEKEKDIINHNNELLESFWLIRAKAFFSTGNEAGAKNALLNHQKCKR